MTLTDSLSLGSVEALAATNFVGGFGVAITGFGENIIFQLGWYLMSLVGLSSGLLVQSVIILTIISWPLLTVQCVLTWRFVNLPLAVTVATAQSIASAVGVAILVDYDNVWLKRSLGMLLLMVWVWRSLIEQRMTVIPPSDGPYVVCRRRNIAMILLFGFAAGLLGGLFATGGPPMMIFVLVAGIRKDEWRSTQAVCNMIQLPVRLAFILMHENTDDVIQLWPECSVSLGAGLFGLLLGNVAAPHVSESAFRQLILLFLLYGGLTMVTAQTGNMTLMAIMLACMGSAATYCRSKLDSRNIKDSTKGDCYVKIEAASGITTH